MTYEIAQWRKGMVSSLEQDFLYFFYIFDILFLFFVFLFFQFMKH